MAPVWEALTDILGAEQLRRRREKGEIEVAPIAFLRGRTLAHAFVIVDEAQNATRLQMKMVLTRLGEGARAWWSPAIPARSTWSTSADSGLAHAVGHPGGRQGHRRRPLLGRGRGPPPAGRADRARLRRRRGQGRAAAI